MHQSYGRNSSISYQSRPSVTAKHIDLINAIVAPALSNSGTYQTESRNYVEGAEHNLWKLTLT